jgi:hypothetical protein
MLIDLASKRITEGKLAEANRLLTVAGLQLSPNISGRILEGKSLKDWYDKALTQLAKALVAHPKG